jgi:hypothetical protein
VGGQLPFLGGGGAFENEKYIKVDLLELMVQASDNRFSQKVRDCFWGAPL